MSLGWVPGAAEWQVKVFVQVHHHHQRDNRCVSFEKESMPYIWHHSSYLWLFRWFWLPVHQFLRYMLSSTIRSSYSIQKHLWWIPSVILCSLDPPCFEWRGVFLVGASWPTCAAWIRELVFRTVLTEFDALGINVRWLLWSDSLFVLPAFQGVLCGDQWRQGLEQQSGQEGCEFSSFAILVVAYQPDLDIQK